MNTSFKYTIQSRPTMYKGREYTSELEAAWACFFDLRGTIAEYEPLLDLKAWRPDFHITIQEEQLIEEELGGAVTVVPPEFILAEIKPYYTLDQWKDDKKTLSKIKDSFVSGFRVCLLGGNPVMNANFIFGVNPDPDHPDNPIFDKLDFGETTIVKQDWERARNTVKWRP